MSLSFLSSFLFLSFFFSHSIAPNSGISVVLKRTVKLSPLSLFCFCTKEAQINTDLGDMALSEFHMVLNLYYIHLFPESLGQGYQEPQALLLKDLIVPHFTSSKVEYCLKTHNRCTCYHSHIQIYLPYRSKCATFI